MKLDNVEVNAAHRLESQATSTRKTTFLLSISLLWMQNAKTGVSMPAR